jgi:hypothetical protein
MPPALREISTTSVFPTLPGIATGSNPPLTTAVVTEGPLDWFRIIACCPPGTEPGTKETYTREPSSRAAEPSLLVGVPFDSATGGDTMIPGRGSTWLTGAALSRQAVDPRRTTARSLRATGK